MSLDNAKKVNAVLVLEIIGRPKEYLVETLEDMAKKISEEKGVFLKNKDIKEPIEMEQNKELFTSFAEIEVETENILYLVILMFKYMPAHIEILSPQNINLTNAELNDVLNELTRRLHGYEEIVRITQTEKMILENKLKAVMGQNKEEVKKDTEIKKDKKKKK